MPRIQRFQRLNIALTMLACTLATATVAEAQADRISSEVSAYRLTETGLAKYSRAVTRLEPLQANLRDHCDESDDDDDSISIDDAAAKLEAVPGVRAALASAGISSHEFVLFTYALFQNGVASWALEQPGGKLPAGVSMENVNFYRAHATELKELGQRMKATDCGGGDTDDEGDGDEAGPNAEA